ncbi:hypothetical protein [Cellulomonas alba]|uniref:Uncharacterized protein n=1 Tax=Cellulomonas alba TaxID=3053467 RepID=A0ABT7SK76_9CELL|nr:hypothetical protein [Cellulomonas alba]MDM7856595.1 hypothetical protein [Cellulomonas alba]
MTLLDAIAAVESPLQLLGALEAHAAGLGGVTTTVHVRADVPALDVAAAAMRGVGLPGGLELTSLPSPRPGSAHWLVGDAFSGRWQAQLARTAPHGDVVLLDDGLATVALARLLVAGRPLIRPSRSSTGAPAAGRRALGGLVTHRLRALAGAGRLRLFTAMPLDPGLLGGLRDLGVDVMTHRFEWLAGRPVVPAPAERTVVVGSALVADGWVRPQPYVEWVRAVGAGEPLLYLPHRRSDTRTVGRIASIDGVRVQPPGLPVEMLLGGLRPPQRVVCLPSTAYVLLGALHASTGVRVDAQPVPDDWWTGRAAPLVREHLSSVLALRPSTHAGPTASEESTVDVDGRLDVEGLRP